MKCGEAAYNSNLVSEFEFQSPGFSRVLKRFFEEKPSRQIRPIG